ncbi:MAG: response regulator transcription factor, partial [Clostridia bacterium]|nr:response regulator transcription factor [Clostridia bacterium]
MRILLIEDSLSLCGVLKTVLQREKYEVQIANDGESGLQLALSSIYDLIIVDVMMPNKSGYAVLKGLRRNRVQSPIIILTALSQQFNKFKGMDISADAYLPKPFSTAELLERVRSLTIRQKSNAKSDDIIAFENVSLNLKSRQLYNENKEKIVKLTQKEFDVLRYFFERPRQVAETELVLRKVWGYEDDNLNSPNFE